MVSDTQNAAAKKTLRIPCRVPQNLWIEKHEIISRGVNRLACISHVNLKNWILKEVVCREYTAALPKQVMEAEQCGVGQERSLIQFAGLFRGW